MCGAGLAGWGIIGLLFGPPMAIWPYRVAQAGELIDAIGRRESGPIEPTDWNVGLTRIIGVSLSFFGIPVFLSCFVA